MKNETDELEVPWNPYVYVGAATPSVKNGLNL